MVEGKNIHAAIEALLFAAEMSAVVHKPYIIGLQILPSPVQACQFTIAGIEFGDIISRIIFGPSQIKRTALFVQLPFRTDMERQIDFIRRHFVFLM